MIDKGGLYADDFLDKPIFKPKETLNDDDDDEGLFEVGELKQEILLNMTSQTEEITVPNNMNYKKATFIHDFIRVCLFILDFIFKNFKFLFSRTGALFMILILKNALFFLWIELKSRRQKI